MGGTGDKSNAKRPPRGVVIRENKTSRSLQIFFAFRGVKCRETLKLEPTAQNIKYADGLRREILRKVEHGSFNYADYFPNSPRAKLFGHAQSRATMGEKLRNYLKVCEGAVEKGRMSPSTYNGYRKAVNGHLMDRWEHKQLRDLTSAELREWIGSLGVTVKTTRNILTPLRSILDDALNDEEINTNPLDKVALGKLLSKTAKESDYEIDPFDTVEREAILKAATQQERNQYGFWFETGLRPGELIALEWSRIDFVHKKARIDQNIVRKTLKAPKTDAGIRDIELNERALAFLMTQKEITFLCPSGRVFHNPRVNGPWETDEQIRKTSWTHLLKKAGVRYRHPYQIRHTFASHQVSTGANLFWLAGQMGHETIEMLIKHYARWLPEKYTESTRETVINLKTKVKQSG